jgi:hypothetical protein
MEMDAAGAQYFLKLGSISPQVQPSQKTATATVQHRTVNQKKI